MSVGSVRKGITQAKFNEEASGVISIEIFVLSVLVGLFFQNWYVFGGMFVGMAISLVIPILNIVMALCLSIIWGLAGAVIVSLLSGVPPFASPASQVTGGLLFILGVAYHISAIEFTRDLVDDEDRNF